MGGKELGGFSIKVSEFISIKSNSNEVQQISINHSSSENQIKFKKGQKLMPKLLKEIYEDFKTSEKREFFVINSRNVLFNAETTLRIMKTNTKS